MNDVMETIMNFINENTTLLISICVFLIFILFIYLIETSIKSKKIDKKVKEGKKNSSLNPTELEEISVKALDLTEKEEEEKKKEFTIIKPKIIENQEFYDVVSEDVKDVDIVYKNDKKLSEILFDDIEKQPSKKLDNSIVKNSDVSTNDERIEELDKIMKKLNNYNNFNN